MGIGNLIMFEPFLRELRFTNKNSNIVALFSNESGAYNFFCDFFSDYVDDIIQLKSNQKNFILKIISGFKLTKNKWDVVYLRFSVSFELYPLIFFKRFNTLVGFKFKNNKNWYYKHLNKYVMYNSDLHESHNYCRLNYDKFNDQLKYPKISSSTEKNNVNKFRIIISPGVSKDLQYKIWPKSYWVELVNYITNNLAYNVVLVGIKEEQETCNYIFNNIVNKNKVKNLNGNLNFIELSNLITTSFLVISSDTMIYHLSNALRKLNLVLLNVTDDKRVLYDNEFSHFIRSYECKGSCITHLTDQRKNNCKPDICMKKLTTEIVIDKLNYIVKKYEKN